MCAFKNFISTSKLWCTNFTDHRPVWTLDSYESAKRNQSALSAFEEMFVDSKAIKYLPYDKYKQITTPASGMHMHITYIQMYAQKTYVQTKYAIQQRTP